MAVEVTPKRVALLVASGSVSGSGNNTVLTPTLGTAIRLYYASYNPASAVEAAFRFGAAGTLFLRNSVGANSVVAKDFSVGQFSYLEGGKNVPLILNLASGVATIWNAFYIEV